MIRLGGYKSRRRTRVLTTPPNKSSTSDKLADCIAQSASELMAQLHRWLRLTVWLTVLFVRLRWRRPGPLV